MAHLDVSCAPVQIQVDVFDFTELGKRVVQIFFTSLLVDAGYEDDPAFYRCKSQKQKSASRLLRSP